MGQKSHGALLGTCLLLGALACVVALLVRRDPESSRKGSLRGQPARASDPASESSELVPADPPSPEFEAARVPLHQGPPSEPSKAAGVPASTASATISGRLRLDGRAVEGGRLLLRSEAGTWEGSAAIDYEGRFRLGAVPVSKLALTFELEAPEDRQLLLPLLEMLPASGQTHELDLDWETRHVNVRVIGDGAFGNQARVHIEGPGILASVETDENGKARLGVVGHGLFSFRAVQPGGRQGMATLELEQGAGLDSVVIQATLPPGR